MWQVQILVDGEWFGWAHDDYDETNRKDAERVAKIAQRFCWTTRIVRVR